MAKHWTEDLTYVLEKKEVCTKSQGQIFMWSKQLRALRTGMVDFSEIFRKLLQSSRKFSDN